MYVVREGTVPSLYSSYSEYLKVPGFFLDEGPSGISNFEFERIGLKNT